jgi:hypothetical protein
MNTNGQLNSIPVTLGTEFEALGKLLKHQSRNLHAAVISFSACFYAFFMKMSSPSTLILSNSSSKISLKMRGSV